MTPLSEILAEIKAASPLLVLPDNPKKVAPDGYEFRAVPAHEWAEEAKLDPDVAALAWTLASEAPDINTYPQYSVAIAEAVCNAADDKEGVKDGFVLAKVTYDKRPMVNGHFGRQGGRWCSSFQRPNGRHLRCAERVLERHIQGLNNLVARGATGWLDPHTQCAIRKAILKKIEEEMAKEPKDERLIERLKDKLAKNPEPEDVMVRRARQGRQWVGEINDREGRRLIDPWRLMLDRREAAPLAGPALDALEAGRRQWGVPQAAL